MVGNFGKLITERKAELEERYRVKEIGLFGSFVKGEQKAGSDLDVLVEFDDPPGLFKFIELENYLSKLVGVKVDLVRKKALKPRIGRCILAEVVYL
jgi:hypothetical protein